MTMSPGDSPSLPPTMKAWTYTKAGSPPDILQLSTSYPTPSPSALAPTELLIKVSHASINPTMRLILNVYPTIPLQKTTPRVAEFEFSGVVVALSANADAALREEFPLGSPVLGMNDPLHEVARKSRGTLAEYVVATAENLIRKPDNVSLEEAAGITVTGCTAMNLVTRAGVRKGDKVLINGGSSGTGLMTVQIVRDILGETGRVVATCSGRNEELVQSLGADEIIDYTKHDSLHKYLATHYSTSHFDVILDTIGIQSLYDHSSAYLSRPTRDRPQRYLNIGLLYPPTTFINICRAILWFLRIMVLPSFLGGGPGGFSFVTTGPSKMRIEKVRRMVEEGKLRAIVDSVWEMDDVMKAYERSMSKHMKGKVVVKVQEV
ncbi:zinc alcohol dehydrogenase [Blastomyces dermatitidis ER-3]|uniref:Zinc alcohol dehydrogenase n=1 Tax=Ajellomyces dermatitidis (strain ER-3 / ATCC MYA-2586) TaxID=559297 RepID=A0ABP2EWA8_AJEDR|nr:zinc alcohol dehydrogenase [Blastomyces dermatitidis ER-3]EEQ88330.1 zinc alcohol dehydrogenase [Blastomyces dermatitidis ER-3]